MSQLAVELLQTLDSREQQREVLGISSNGHLSDLLNGRVPFRAQHLARLLGYFGSESLDTDTTLTTSYREEFLAGGDVRLRHARAGRSDGRRRSDPAEASA